MPYSTYGGWGEQDFDFRPGSKELKGETTDAVRPTI